jgi:hypothetical protein
MGAQPLSLSHGCRETISRMVMAASLCAVLVSLTPRSVTRM